MAMGDEVAQGKGFQEKTPPRMKLPVLPVPELPAQARVKADNSRKSGSSSRRKRDFETGSPPWSSPPEEQSSPSSPPKPAEIIERYVAQGMAREAASEKAIEDLQAALQRSLYPMQRLVLLEKTFRTSASHMENAVQRLSLIEAKLDSRPNLPQVFAAGVAAGAFLQAAAKATPPIVAILNDMLGNIRRIFQR